MGIVISQFAGGAPSPLLSLYDGFLNTRRTNCKVLFHQASVREKAAYSCMLCNEMRQNGLFTPDIGKSCDRIYNAWQNSCAILAICERGRATAGRLGLGQTSRERQQARACICGKVSKAEGRDARCAPPRPQSLERRLPPTNHGQPLLPWLHSKVRAAPRSMPHSGTARMLNRYSPRQLGWLELTSCSTQTTRGPRKVVY